MRSYAGGRRWRVLEDGRVEVEGAGVITSGGRPQTARLLLLEHGDALRAASSRFDIPIPWLVGMTTIEAIRYASNPRGGFAWDSDRVVKARGRGLAGRGLKLLASKGVGEEEARRLNRLRCDIVSIRYEPGYISPEDTPGLVSAGLMQTLLSTARAVVAEFPDLAPLDRQGKSRALHLGDLLDPAMSLLLGAGYLAMQREQYKGTIKHLRDGAAAGRGLDFVLATGSYNAGSLRIDDGENPNPFKLVTYSNTRTTRGIQFHNDCYHKDIVSLWKS